MRFVEGSSEDGGRYEAVGSGCETAFMTCEAFNVVPSASVRL